MKFEKWLTLTAKKPSQTGLTSDKQSATKLENTYSKKLNDAAERALDHYLNPAAHIMASTNNPEPMYLANPRYNTESLLANASETLNSAREMASSLAFELEGPQRSLLLAIHQLLEMSGLLVDQALDQVAPT